MTISLSSSVSRSHTNSSLRTGATPPPQPAPSASYPFSLAERQEIHKAKAGASFWAGLFGPFKPAWDFFLYSPQKAALKRQDVASGQRSVQSGIALETEKKNSQLKASILPAVLFCSNLLVGGSSLLTGLVAYLSYTFGEKPESQDFNKYL
jgi:hypothetical protein